MRTDGIIVSSVLVVALAVLPVRAALADELPWIKPADNPLLGGWQLVEEADLQHIGGHCATGMTFEPARQTVFQGAASTIGKARYFARNGLIVVLGQNASVESGILSYRSEDRDHMDRRDYLLCSYRRGDPTQQAAAPPLPDCPPQDVIEEMKHPDPQTPITYEQAMEIIRCEK